MRLRRILAIAAAFQAAAVSAAGGLLGLAGAWNGWADAVNVLAWLWLVLGLGGLALGVAARGRGRALVVLLAALGLVSSGVRVGPELVSAGLQRLKPASAERLLTVLTLNVWNENGARRETAAAIAAADADIVALQERHGLGRDLEALFEFYPGRVTCRGRADQFVVLSKTKPIGGGCRDISGPDGERGVGLAWLTVIAPDGHAYTVATTHLGWPVPPGRQAAQSARLAAVVQSLNLPGLILTGDFNMPPWTWAMQRQDRDLAPLARRTLASPTWPARLPRMGVSVPAPFLPIDHIYTDLEWNVVDQRRIRTPGSDHFGVLMSLSR